MGLIYSWYLCRSKQIPNVQGRSTIRKFQKFKTERQVFHMRSWFNTHAWQNQNTNWELKEFNIWVQELIDECFINDSTLYILIVMIRAQNYWTPYYESGSATYRSVSIWKVELIPIVKLCSSKIVNMSFQCNFSQNWVSSPEMVFWCVESLFSLNEDAMFVTECASLHNPCFCLRESNSEVFIFS